MEKEDVDEKLGLLYEAARMATAVVTIASSKIITARKRYRARLRCG